MNPAKRPMPPAELLERQSPPVFAIAPDLIEWARATFIDDEAILFNEMHRHLQGVTLGALWANITNARQQRTVVGEWEIPMQGAWQMARGREEVQLNHWFGCVPDFVLTCDAGFRAQADDRSIQASLNSKRSLV